MSAKLAILNVHNEYMRLNELYGLISSEIINKVIALGGTNQDAKYILDSAKSAHAEILETESSLYEKYWIHKDKEFG